MIIVSAATGEFGRLVVECLLDRLPPSEVAVAVRDPAKADGFAARGVEVRHGDYDDVESLRRSFEGADRLLFISSPMWDSAQRMVQHRHVVTAAREAEVGLLVYTSAGGADRLRSRRPGRPPRHRAVDHRQRASVHDAAAPVLLRDLHQRGSAGGCGDGRTDKQYRRTRA